MAPYKPRTTSFFPLRKLKGNQPLPKKPVVHAWLHLEEEDADAMAKTLRVMTLVELRG